MTRSLARTVRVFALLTASVPTLPAPSDVTGPEFRVNAFTTGIQANPAVACDSAGGFLIVWSQSDGSGDGISGRRFSLDGSAAGDEFQVNSWQIGSQGAPDVAFAKGSFFVVWEDRGFAGSANYNIVGARFDSSGTPLGDEFLINTYWTADQLGPRVSASATGGFVVIWDGAGQDGSLSGVFAQRFDSTGTMQGSEFRVNSYTTANQRRGTLAMDALGGFVVAWESYGQDGAFSAVEAQRYASDGSASGGEFQVNTYTTGVQDRPVVWSSASSGFVVFWHSPTPDGGGFEVLAQRFDSGGTPQGASFRVNESTTGGQTVRSVASDAAGGFVVVWDSGGQDGSSYGVFGQRFDASGGRLGGEFRVNTYTTNAQRFPAVAGDAAGNFVVVWQSDLQDLDGYGVFSQRFCTSLASVTIGVNGSTTVCPTGTGGLATVADSGGGASTHQWGFRTMMGGTITDIVGQTGTSYTINGADFPGAGSYFLVCTTSPSCGSVTTSNEVGVTVDATDATAPVVTPPPAAAVTQTLCQ